MQESMLNEAARERHGQLLHEAETFRRMLGSRKVKEASPILKSLIVFLIAIV